MYIYTDELRFPLPLLSISGSGTFTIGAVPTASIEVTFSPILSRKVEIHCNLLYRIYELISIPFISILSVTLSASEFKMLIASVPVTIGMSEVVPFSSPELDKTRDFHCSILYKMYELYISIPLCSWLSGSVSTTGVKSSSSVSSGSVREFKMSSLLISGGFSSNRFSIQG